MEDVKESINKTNKITNKEIIESYLDFYKHSEQSIRTRRSVLNYFFIRFGYIDHIFNINKRILMNYFNYLNQLENITLKTKKMKWIILKGLCQFVNEYYEEELDKPRDKLIKSYFKIGIIFDLIAKFIIYSINLCPSWSYFRKFN